ncbi:methylhydantoinase [Allosaccharopolyspora coralli]|uniref:Methylhydantoinase n=2 Tax=Allosaccharopolyspora coralli TaxID=2665642 RepID=A0A5Q3QCT8_9PSEU|nr:methylhydantoinase [Allosaccharopolyspora coralli]
MKRIGVDVGGTFTDLYFLDEESGRVVVEKVPSTPSDPSRAVLDGLEALCVKADVRLDEVDQLLHGTTVATNIALTHTGADVGLITTEGFRDVLHIGRHKKPHNFSLQQDLSWQSLPLVKRRNRVTVAERVTAPDGEVLTALDEDEVRERVRNLREAGVDAIAVCLLHSYLNDTHERRIKEIVHEEYPDCYLSISSEVVPLYREFERFSTTALNAYVGPRVSGYLRHLATELTSRGFHREVLIMQSSGGMIPIETAADHPVNLLMSGPVAGLTGGIWAGSLAERSNVVTLDIGGTSADIGVAVDGEMRMRHLLDTKVGDYQAMVPMVDIDTIGAGGGSLAYVDEGGVYRVGPQSAGADPGPACYGRGGTQATATDAQVVLGRMRGDQGLAGGGMRLNVDAARQAFSPIADELGMSVEDAAIGAVQVQKFGMTQAIELSSVRRGYDPRDFTLVAGGGAGPLFAAEIAAELNIPRVLVPANPGIIAATGLLATDHKHEFVATERHTVSTMDLSLLAKRYGELTEQAMGRLERDGVEQHHRVVQRLAECRCEGQGYEVRFEVPHGDIDESWVDRLQEAFHEAHEAEYGHRFAGAEVELVNIRVVGIGRIEPLDLPTLPPNTQDVSAAEIDRRDVVFDSGGRAVTEKTPFYDRQRLENGHEIVGPAVIEQYDTTTVVPPGFVASLDSFGNIVIACPEPDSSAPAESDAADDLAAPILMRVIGGAFTSIAKEMASVLFRMAYSSIIRESEDLGAGIFDAQGNVLAESDSTPMFMGAMPKIVRGVIEELADDIHEGDVILHNDPYMGATHSPDVAVVTPIFWRGELVGFAGASGQLLDIGGAYPGLAIDLVDNQAEGQIFRAIKISDRGVRQDKLMQHILTNTRTPTQNEGDIEAMIAACDLATRRFLTLVGRYGKDTVLEAGGSWLSYSERMLRAEIAKVPDGVYETETGYLDDDGVNPGEKLPVKVKVIIEGDEITYDLTGSSDEVPSAYNCPFEGTTMSAFAFITRMIFLDEVAHPTFVPQNEGMLRPVSVIAPEGSIFNPRYPRACFARFCQVQRAVDLALRALSPVLPDQVTAGNSAHLHFMSYSGWEEERGEYWVYLEVNEGSYGGRPERDGLDSVDCLIANTRNNPIEELEWRFPMRTDRYELRSEPCAAGRTRGGVGMVRVNRFLVDTVVTCEGERHESDVPWGVFGGHDGANASLVKNPGSASEENWPSKVNARPLKAGDCVEITVPNSGGYGDPYTREPGKVLEDFLDELTTVELARRDYGVVIDTGTMSVDTAATDELRAQRATV